MRTLLIALFCASTLTACATGNHEARPFDPIAFLEMLTPTGEETICHVGQLSLPCKFYREDLGESTFVALFHPKMGYLLCIKEVRIDGTQSNVWSRPTDPQRVVPTLGGSQST